MHRLFVAIDLPEHVKDAISALKADIPGAAWAKRNTFHITLRFLGDGLTDAQRDTIREALRAVKAEPFTLTPSGVGRFPPGAKKAARVLWVGTEAQPALTSLHHAIEAALSEIGFPPETKHDFNAHITVARLKIPSFSDEIARFLEENRDFRQEPIAVNTFVLYKSELTPQGALYTPVEIYPLDLTR
jgi:RNA 2',3'-cyclic 3'-phosphodiesterase